MSSTMRIDGTGCVEMSEAEAAAVAGGGYWQSFYDYWFAGTLRNDGTVKPRMGAVLPTNPSQTCGVGARIRATNALAHEH